MAIDSEYEHIQSLLIDFPAKKITPEQALKKIKIRYDQLSKNLVFSFGKILKDEEYSFPIIFFELTKFFHEFLCKHIFSNGGKFRKSSEPNSGSIRFGPYDKRGYDLKYSGTPADRIDPDLKNIFEHLSREDEKPILNAIRLYQSFVYIHLFYDVKGRIGRLLSSLYLSYYRYYIFWKPLEQDMKLKESFIGKLNKCHNQMNKPNYNYKLNTLNKFWENYIITFDKLSLLEKIP